MNHVTEQNVKAYVLINAILGKSKEVLDELSKHPNITTVASTTGMYDFIVKIAVSELSDFEDVITNYIQNIPGIKRTETQVVIHEKSGDD